MPQSTRLVPRSRAQLTDHKPQVMSQSLKQSKLADLLLYTDFKLILVLHLPCQILNALYQNLISKTTIHVSSDEISSEWLSITRFWKESLGRIWCTRCQSSMLSEVIKYKMDLVILSKDLQNSSSGAMTLDPNQIARSFRCSLITLRLGKFCGTWKKLFEISIEFQISGLRIQIQI